MGNCQFNSLASDRKPATAVWRNRIESTQSLRITSRGLTRPEQEKFGRMATTLSALFLNAGYDIQVCDGSGEGQNRTINFLRGQVGAPFVSLPSLEFQTMTSDELTELIVSQLPLSNH